MSSSSASAAASGRMSASSRIVVATSVLASLLEIIDTSIVNVALPRMQGNLGVTLDEITMVSTGYIISNAVVLPIASWLGLKIGRKRYYTGCILLFTITSLLCGLAPNFYFLVVARIFQGAAGGALLPTSQTLIQEQFPGERSGIGSAIYGMSVMIGPALGPTLGGYLTDHYEWRSIFFINLPIGIVASILSYLYVGEEKLSPEAEEARKQRVDLLGFTLLVIGLAALQFLLERGQANDWFESNLILICGVVAAIALPVFFAYEYNHRSPIVDVRLFRVSAVRDGTMLMAATGLILYASIFIIPIYTDRILGMDATHTGYLYIPGSLATMAVMPIVGRFMTQIGAKPFIFAGVVLNCVSLYLMAHLTTAAGAGDIMTPLIVRGVGLGFIFVPVNSAVLSQFQGQQLGQAAGLLNLARQIGGSVGVAGVSTLLERWQASNLNIVRSSVSYHNPQAVQSFEQSQETLATQMANLIGVNGSTIGLGENALAPLKSLVGRIQTQVFQLTFNQLMMALAVIYALSLIPLFSMKLKRKVTGPVSAH